jgi:site-specific DNA-cytosine methylase
MKVLSLFDGISAGQLALQRAGIKCDYYASEIDKYAIKVTQANYPDTTQLGDVTQIKNQSCDLLLAGSPCQGFSFAGKQLNFNDERSKLFFEFVRIKEESAPKYFLLENVRMKQEYQDIISDILGVPPIKINSALVSGQNRTRLYWTNIPFIRPNDRGIEFKDVLEADVDKKYYVSQHQLSRLVLGDLVRAGGVCFQNPGKEMSKCPCLMARHYKGISGRNYYPAVVEPDGLRKLAPEECEKLQTFPVGYTKGISDTQRFKSLGNAWTVDIVAHILRSLV